MPVKRLGSIFFLLVYLVVNSGFVINMHYCMNRLDSVEVGGSNSKKCDKCGMHKDGKCCKDEVRVIKLKSTHVTGGGSPPSFEAPAIMLPAYTGYDVVGLPVARIVPAVSHGPPIAGPDKCILNCVFRI